MSFFRYPGGKSKLKNQIVDKLNLLSENKKLEYREPFFGGGSIGLEWIDKTNKIWINDIDYGVSSLWACLISHPEELKILVNDFQPSVEQFYKFKEDLNKKDMEDVISFGFKKLAIHQISYSGLGVKSGGPLGGRDQKSKYKIDCRWSPHYICKKIDLIHNKLKKLCIRHNCCTNLDFSNLIEDNQTEALIYLDPPYYVKGNELYQFGFSNEDHARLSDCLINTHHKWLLSYDDCDEIRDLYKWANIEEINVNYTITATKEKQTGKRESRSKSELLITKE